MSSMSSQPLTPHQRYLACITPKKEPEKPLTKPVARALQSELPTSLSPLTPRQKYLDCITPKKEPEKPSTEPLVAIGLKSELPSSLSPPLPPAKAICKLGETNRLDSERPSEKQLPDSVITRISGFSTDHSFRPVSKRWNHLFRDDILKLKHDITDKELIKILSKQKNLTEIDLSNCKNITDKSIKHLSKFLNLEKINLSHCGITDAGLKELSHLKYLTSLNLSHCGITDEGMKDVLNLKNLRKFNGSDQWSSFKFIYAEAIDLMKFIKDKSRKFGIKCHLSIDPDFYDMGCELNIKRQEAKIFINSLYLLESKNIDLFLLEHPDHQKSIKTFLTQKKPELLDKAATDLIKMFNSVVTPSVLTSKYTNILMAKEILIMHAIGILSKTKRCTLTHELAHVHEHFGGRSLGWFDPRVLDFIPSHQYEEVRADLTAAREEHAHEVCIIHFEWRHVILPQPKASSKHPADLLRARAFQMDQL